LLDAQQHFSVLRDVQAYRVLPTIEISDSRT